MPSTRKTSLVAFAALAAISGADAFSAPTGRRQAFANIAKLVGGAASTAGLVGGVEPASAGLSNPAQFGKGKSTGGGAFIPGKGIRRMNDEQLVAGLSNPAQFGN